MWTHALTHSRGKGFRPWCGAVQVGQAAAAKAHELDEQYHLTEQAQAAAADAAGDQNYN